MDSVSNSKVLKYESVIADIELNGCAPFIRGGKVFVLRNCSLAFQVPSWLVCISAIYVCPRAYVRGDQGGWITVVPALFLNGVCACVCHM